MPIAAREIAIILVILSAFWFLNCDTLNLIAFPAITIAKHIGKKLQPTINIVVHKWQKPTKDNIDMINPRQLPAVFNIELRKCCLKSILKDVSVAKYTKKIIDSKDDTRTNI